MEKILSGLLGASILLIAASVQATPISAHWVNLNSSLSTITQAEAALDDINGQYNHFYTQESVIDFSQDWNAGNDADSKVSGYMDTPIDIADDLWAVEFTADLNVATAGEYDLFVFTDDGFDLRIDGNSVMSFNANRAPMTSFDTLYLSEGLHSFELIHWENYGVEAVEFSWRPASSVEGSISLVSDFVPSAVPEPSTMILFGAGIVCLAAIGRKKRK